MASCMISAGHRQKTNKQKPKTICQREESNERKEPSCSTFLTKVRSPVLRASPPFLASLTLHLRTGFIITQLYP